MKPLPSFSFFAIIAFAAAAFLATTTHNGGNLLRAQDAKGDAANAAKQGAVQGKGAFKGKAPVDTLGAGPWDIKTEAATVRVSVVTKGLDHPWGMAFVPGSNDILVTERPGRLRLVRNGVLDPTPIGALPEIRAVTLGGLLDIALHPNFAQNRLIYFSYSKPGAEEPARATLAVARARWDGGARLTELKDVFVADAYHGGRGAPKGCCGQGPSDGSYGSRILFDNAGFLYITSGDRNYGEKSQDPMSHIGKILRLKDDYDGAVPAGNSVAILALLKLAAIADRRDWKQMAEKSLRLFADRLHQAPQGAPAMLSALAFWLEEPVRVVIAGALSSADTRALVAAAHSVYQPRKVVLGNAGLVEPLAKTLSAQQDRATAYVCLGTMCLPWTHEPQTVRERIQSARKSAPSR